MPSPTRYAKAGDVHIAWSELGDGPTDLVFCSAYVSHVEHLMAHPLPAALFERLARFCRVILFDRRGSGLSDRVLSAPTLEEQMQDILTVMDAAGSERAALMGFTGGGPLAILAAATHPERCSALVLAASFARTGWAPDYEWAPTDEAREPARAHLFASWGDGSRARTMFPSAADDPSFVSWFGALERLSSGPGDARHVFGLLDQVDVRDALPLVQAPTLVLQADELIFLDIRHSEYLARHIPAARLVRYPGGDALPLTRAGPPRRACPAPGGAPRARGRPPAATRLSAPSRSCSPVTDTTPRPPARCRRSCSPTSSSRRHAPPGWATTHGQSSSTATSTSSVRASTAGEVALSRRSATASSRPSTAPRAPCDAHWRSPTRAAPGFRSAPDSIPGKSNASATISAGSPSTSAPASRPSPAPARCSSPRPSRTSSSGPGSP